MTNPRPIPLPTDLALPLRQLELVHELARQGGEAGLPVAEQASVVYALERKGLIQLVRRTRTTGGGGYRHIYRLKLAGIVAMTQEAKA